MSKLYKVVLLFYVLSKKVRRYLDNIFITLEIKGLAHFLEQKLFITFMFTDLYILIAYLNKIVFCYLAMNIMEVFGLHLISMACKNG